MLQKVLTFELSAMLILDCSLLKPIVKGIGSEVGHRLLWQFDSISFIAVDLVESGEKGKFPNVVFIDVENFLLVIEMIDTSTIKLEVADWLLNFCWNEYLFDQHESFQFKWFCTFIVLRIVQHFKWVFYKVSDDFISRRTQNASFQLTLKCF